MPLLALTTSPTRRSSDLGVARIYGALGNGGTLDGVTLMSRDQIEAMITLQHEQVEALQDRPYRQALGVLLNHPEWVYMGPKDRKSTRLNSSHVKISYAAF